MRRMAVINQKGGVGKTTTTANLGAALARAGSRVLLIDLDPQGHLSLHFGSELAPGQPSVYDVLTDSLPIRDALIDAGKNVSLLPADIDLAGAEAELSSVTGREVLLREALEPLQDDYDYLLIDCPPSLGVLTVNALVAANEVLIPLQAHFLALQGLSRLLGRTVTLVRQRINPQLRVEGVVLCMHEPATRLAGEVVDDLTKFLESSRGTNVAWADAKLYKTCIRRNIKLAESSSFGQTVFDYAPRSNGALDYAKLAQEIFPTCNVSEPDAPIKSPVVSAPPSVTVATPEAEPAQLEVSTAQVSPTPNEEQVVPGNEPRTPKPPTSPVVVPSAPAETRPAAPVPAPAPIPVPVPAAMAYITLGSGAPMPVRVTEKANESARVPIVEPPMPAPLVGPPADSLPNHDAAPGSQPEDASERKPSAIVTAP